MVTLQLNLDDAKHRAAIVALVEAFNDNPTPEPEPAPTPEPDPVPEPVPTPEPEPEAPESSTEGTAVAAGTPDTCDPSALDKNGVPYDSRIHTGTRTKNQDGSWRRKRGQDPAEVERIEAELRHLVGGVVGNPSAAEESAEAPQFGTTPPPSMFGQQPPAQPPVQHPPVQQQPEQRAPAPGGDAPTFPTLMARIARDGVSAEQIRAACEAAGVSGLPALGPRQDLVPAVYSALFPNG